MRHIASTLLSRQVTYLNLKTCIIGPFANLGLYPDFGPYPSPQPPKHEAQRGEVVIVGVRPVVMIVGVTTCLFLLTCVAPLL